MAAFARAADRLAIAPVPPGLRSTPNPKLAGSHGGGNAPLPRWSAPRDELGRCSATGKGLRACPRRLSLPLAVRSSTQQGIVSSELGTTAPITFNIGETSLTLPFSVEQPRALDGSIAALLQTFREKEQAARAQRWQSMEFRHSGDGVSLELFCNPNAYSNAFQAEVLITVKDSQLKLTSEGPLSGIKNDLDQYISAHQ